MDSIVSNLTLINPELKLEAGNTLIFFDEMQDCPACATSLKAFKLDGRYDVICSGSMIGINYREIESNSVGYKEDELSVQRYWLFSEAHKLFHKSRRFAPQQTVKKR